MERGSYLRKTMPRPLTLYKGDKVQRNVYPDELAAWQANGWSTTRTPVSTAPPAGDSEDTQAEPAPETPELLNINTATADEIAKVLDGIGSSRAKHIIEKRETLDGGYTDLNQIPWISDEHYPLIALGGD